VIREIWLLRLWALPARANGDNDAYAHYRDRYRDMAKTLNFEGHIAWAKASHDAAALSGVVTFLFTDVEGSILVGGSQTRTGCGHPCWRTNDVLRTAIGGHGGFLFEHTGDGVCAEFSSPKSAVDAAVVAQGAL